MRIGIGYDTHALSENRELILGGVVIPYKLGLLGHSDADVLTHAIIDALLGAAGLPDIGNFFPDDDPRYKDADSFFLLDKVMNEIREDFDIVNIDSIILCERPKLKVYIPRMKERLSRYIGAPVNVKATTTEKMNAEGEGRCISAQAIVLLEKRKHIEK